MDLQITATNEHGTFTVNGWGWPANDVAIIQATDTTAYSEYGRAQCDGSGSFVFTCPDPCEAAGPFYVAATNGEPQPGAEYNYVWSNVVEIQCHGPAGHGQEAEEPEYEEPEAEYPEEDTYGAEGTYYDEETVEEESESY